MPALAIVTELRVKSGIPAPGIVNPTTSSRTADIVASGEISNAAATRLR